MPAEFFTTEELEAAIAKNGPPEGYEAIPDEHRAKYLLLAMREIALVQTTLPDLVLQLQRPANPIMSTIRGNGGCAAGLQRAMNWINGFRHIGNGTDIADQLTLPQPKDKPE